MRQAIVILVHVLISAVFAGIAGLGAHKVLISSLSMARAEMLQSYIRVRADREQTLFDEARTLTEAAEDAFLRRHALIAEIDVAEEFNALFPPFGDGTAAAIPTCSTAGPWRGPTMSSALALSWPMARQ